jgi:uncharacterized protein YmfQ (DUF2313 family)
MGALFSAAQYAEKLQALLPRGRVWGDGVQGQVTAALAPSFERLDARAQQLLFDAMPPNTVELLPEWEASLGLPDPCEGPDQTTDQRRAQVIAKFCASGGQSIAYYQGVLETLGYTNSVITQFAPFRAGRSMAGDPAYDSRWWFAWNIYLPDLRVFFFRAGLAAAGDPLVTYPTTAVFCVIAALKPAHTVATFTFAP